MTAILYIALYAFALISLAGCAARAVAYARKPIHLRWELYPVPHEDPERVQHGGSRFEDTGGWARKPRFSLLGELRCMLPEMLFMKALYGFNRKLWYRSFPFHLGLYLLIKSGALVLFAALLWNFAPSCMSGLPGLILHWLYTILGVAGAALTLAGAFMLLLRRLTDPDLKAYTVFGDLFNLAFFIIAFGLLFAGYVLRPEGKPGGLELVLGLITFDTALKVPGLFAAGLLLCSLLAAYIPLTHMSHFIGKYFTYHAVRWDDAPNLRGGALERKLAEYLTYRPTWSSGHVSADGKKSWAGVAAENPWEGAKK